MNESDVAHGVASGALPSPTRCGNAWLHDVRISGSGMAERRALGETAYRPPEIWTSPEMVQRSAGLPVIMGHPEDATLDGDEFAARVVGTIVLPFVRNGELRGIARVFDADVSAAMASGEFSTSPSVTLDKANRTRIAGTEGVLLIEGDPSLLDHIAIVPNNGAVGGGVWDKGGPPKGIRNDSNAKEITMAEENEKKPDAAQVEGDDKMTAVMDAIGKVADMCGSIGKRMDALEKGARSDSSNEKIPVRADDTYPPDTNTDEAERADAQMRCDSVANAHGERAPAPMIGERPRAYRERLLRNFMRHSKEFGAVDLSAVPSGPAFDGIEGRIFADALEAAKHPTTIDGTLRPITRYPNGPDGPKVITYAGSWNDGFAPFRIKPRKYMGATQHGARLIDVAGSQAA